MALSPEKFEQHLATATALKPVYLLAGDEHLLARVAREGLGIMTGLFWDLAEPGSVPARERTAPSP